MYDAIIIGARCAGAPTGMLLARKGHRVLLLERGVFPSDTLSSHFIHPPGIRFLKNWGLLEQVAATNAPAIRTYTADFGPFRISGSPPPAGDVGEARCVRRRYLDQVLAQAAVAAGAELREGFCVQELTMDAGRVTGVRGCTSSGQMIQERARVVVGADGMHSFVARQVEATQYNVVEPLTCNYYSYWSGLELSGPELCPRENRFVVAAPTNNGLTIINVAAPRAEFAAFRADIEGSFLRTLRLAPNLEQQVLAGKREERWFGTADTVNFFRRPYGPGWVLVGDAGYHRDAITAQGITDAFRTAAATAGALHEVFSGRADFCQALADCHCERDESVMPMYRLTCDLARLAAPTPQQRDMFKALQQNQTATDEFFGTIAGTVPVDQFYGEENLGRICLPPVLAG